MPILPRETLLIMPMEIPPMTDVPQPGPITRRPFSRASCLSSISSSRGTLSLKMNTFAPCINALRASSPANSPATEMMTRFASGTASKAASTDLYSLDSSPDFFSVLPASSFSSNASASASIPSFSVSKAIINVLDVAAWASGVNAPISASTDLFKSVPITRVALFMPSSFFNSLPAVIEKTESRYRFSLMIVLIIAVSPQY